MKSLKLLGLFCAFALVLGACDGSSTSSNELDHDSNVDANNNPNGESSSSSVSISDSIDSEQNPFSSSSESQTYVDDGLVAWDYLNPKINYGEMTDERDGQVYKTTVIAGHVWMAENLNYAYEDSSTRTSPLSLCYDNNPALCKKYGRLYLWSAAMDSAGFFSDSANNCGNLHKCTVSNPVRGVCPEGWHLPADYEWEALINFVGIDSAGIKLKSLSGWSNDSPAFTVNEDSYGFSVLPGGFHTDSYNDKRSLAIGGNAYFWTTLRTGQYDEYARVVDFWSTKADVGTTPFSIGSKYSYVRCTKDSADAWSWDLPKEARHNSEFDDEILTDSRDNQTYKTVKIGNQIWMAENLNYNDESGQSWCYDNNADYCLVTGRLYTWSAAIDSIALSLDEDEPQTCGMGVICDRLKDEVIEEKPIRGICPEGWHLPSTAEWDTLIAEVGGEEIAGLMLKSTSGWNSDERYGNGKDVKGFSILPAGSGYLEEFEGIGKNTFFWSSSQLGIMSFERNFATYYSFFSGEHMFSTGNSKIMACSVRCLKD